MLLSAVEQSDSVIHTYIYMLFKCSFPLGNRRLDRQEPGYIGGFATKTRQLKHQRMTVAVKCNRMLCNIIFWCSDYLVFVAKSAYYPASSLTSSGQSLRAISEAARQAWSPQKIQRIEHNSRGEGREAQEGEPYIYIITADSSCCMAETNTLL